MKKKMSDLDGLRMKLEQKEADRKMDSMAVEYGKRDSAWVADKQRKMDIRDSIENAKYKQEKKLDTKEGQMDRYNAGRDVKKKMQKQIHGK